MKNSYSAVGFLLFILFAVIFFNSCTSGTNGNLLSFASTPQSVVMEGRLDGIEVRATVRLNAGAEEGESVISIRFLAPNSLSGVVVTRYANGETQARLGDVCIDSSAISGLIEPFFLMLTPKEYASISKSDKNSVEIRVSDDERALTYVIFNEETLPQRIYGSVLGREVDFHLESFERK